jgi:Flagellar hook-length control protein FliK
MKPMLLPLIGADAPTSAGDESTSSDKDAGQGFDAVLALVSAQAVGQVPAPKQVSAAPVVAPPLEGNASTPAQPAAARASQAARLVHGAGHAIPQGFGPWLAVEVGAELAAPQVAADQPSLPPVERPSAGERGGLEPVPDDSSGAEPASAQDSLVGPDAGALAAQAAAPAVAAQVVGPALAAQAAAPAPVPAAARQAAVAVDAAAAPRPVATQRASVRPVEPAAAEAQAARLFQRELFDAPPAAPVRDAGAARAGDTARTNAPSLAAAPNAPSPAAAPNAPSLAAAPNAPSPTAAPNAPSPAAAPNAPSPAAAPNAPSPAAAPLAPSSAAAPNAPSPGVPVAARVVPAVSAQTVPVQQAAAKSAQTGAELVAAARSGAPTHAELSAADAVSRTHTSASAAAQGSPALVSTDPRVSVRMVQIGGAEAEPVASPPSAEAGARIAAPAQQEPAQAEPESAPEAQPLEVAPGRVPQVQPPVPQLSAEVQGARGLEAVVASLLRAGNRDASLEQPSVRGAARRSAALPAVETTAAVEAATARVKLAEGAASAQDAMARQRDEREPAPRDQLELPLPHALPQPELAPRNAPPLEASASPLPALPQLLDPEAAQAGKPGQMGAAITIDHPELGAMDLLVQNQNGRIEVRAILETPHAAQVLRAHESALRYGIQQAGMTLGALRVRTRSADGETVKARDTVKQRRRDHEWEA